jgi:hypothetical protein
LRHYNSTVQPVYLLVPSLDDMMGFSDELICCAAVSKELLLLASPLLLHSAAQLVCYVAAAALWQQSVELSCFHSCRISSPPLMSAAS